MWNNSTMKIVLGIVCLLAVIGCGHDKVVTVGEPGAKGEYRRDIDKANDVAAESTSRIKTGEKEIYGD